MLRFLTGISVLTSWPTDNVHPTASVCNLPAWFPSTLYEVADMALFAHYGGPVDWLPVF